MILLRNIHSSRWVILRSPVRQLSRISQVKVRAVNPIICGALLRYNIPNIPNIPLKRCYSTSLLKQATIHSIPIEDYFDYQYSRINNFLLDIDSRKKYLQYITSKKSFEKQEIDSIVEDYNRLVDMLHDIEYGWGFFRDFWQAIYNRNVLNEPSILNLQARILDSRIRICKLLLRKGDYTTYSKYVLPSIESLSRLNPLETCMNIFQIEKLKSSKGKHLRSNIEGMREFFHKDEVNVSLKVFCLKLFTQTVLKLVDDMEERLTYIDLFFELRNTIEGTDWIFEQDDTFDAIFRSISKPAANVSFPDYATRLVELIKQRYQDTTSTYLIITKIMETIQETDPLLCMKYFKFKLNSTTAARFKSVVFPDDLQCAMIANLHNPRHSYRLYKRFPNLHSPEQVTTLFRTSVASQNWFSLSERFTKYYGRKYIIFPTEEDRENPEQGYQGKLIKPESMDHSYNFGLAMKIFSESEHSGASRRLGLLQQQVKSKNLPRTWLMYSSMIWSRVRTEQYKIAFMAYDKFIQYLSRHPKIDPSGSERLFSIVLPSCLQVSDFSITINLLNRYLDIERELKIYLIPPKDIVTCIDFLAKNFSLVDIQKIYTLCDEYEKWSSEVIEGFISAYTYLGQYELADKLVYRAHELSKPAFSNQQIFSLQYRNLQTWINCDGEDTRIDKNNRTIQMLQQIFSQCLILEHIEEYRSLVPFLIEFHLEHGNFEMATKIFSASKKKFILSEDVYYPILNHLVCNLNDHTQFETYLQMMKDDGIQLTARTYYLCIRTYLSLGQHPEKSLTRMFDVYGITDIGKREHVLNYKQDAKYICKSVILFLKAKKSSNIKPLTDFIERTRHIYNGSMPFEIRSMIYEFMKLYFNRQGEMDKLHELNKAIYQDYRRLISSYISKYPFKNSDLIIAPKLKEHLGNSLISELKISIFGNESKPETHVTTVVDSERMRVVVKAIQTGLIEGVIDNHANLNKLIQLLVLVPNFEYLITALEICQQQIIQNTWKIVRQYEAKKLCYKLCVCYLGDNYGDKVIEEQYKPLSHFYGIESIEQTRKEIDELPDKPKNFDSFIRSESGNLFDLKEIDSYPFTSMNINQFVEFFNPEQFSGFFQNYLASKTTEMLYNSVIRCCQGNPERLNEFNQRFPETLEYLMEHRTLSQRFHQFCIDLKTLYTRDFYKTNQKLIKLLEDKPVFDIRSDSTRTTPINTPTNILTSYQKKLQQFYQLKENFEIFQQEFTRIVQDYSHVNDLADEQLLKIRQRIKVLNKKLNRQQHEIFTMLGLELQGPKPEPILLRLRHGKYRLNQEEKARIKRLEKQAARRQAIQTREPRKLMRSRKSFKNLRQFQLAVKEYEDSAF